MKKNFKVFKTEEGRQRILDCYRKLLENVSFSYQERFVYTSFGKTYLLEAGDSGKPVMFLVHGSCSNSAAWFGDIGALSEQYHVYSADIVGDAGNSEANRLDPSTDEFADWLKEVFDRLSIEKATLAGNSLGGWVSLQFAAKYPERIHQLVLIASAGIVPIKLSFILKTFLYLMQGEKGRKAMAGLIFGNDDVPQAVLDFTRLVGENFNPLTGALPILADARMQKLSMPVLYIAGRNDATADVGKAAERLKSLVPSAEIRIIEYNGHVVYDAMKWVVSF